MNAFMARQPIFDRRQKVFGYELLFREGLHNYYQHVDGDQASNSVIADSFLLMGMHTVTGGKRAFINFTSNLLKNQIAMSLPKELIAVEILEDVQPDEEIVLACKKLKQLGYLIALDDFVFHPRYQPLIDLADIIKVDFLNTSYNERLTILHSVGPLGIKFLAEKVETPQQYAEALSLGYSYFQGYFFSQPIILTGKEIPSSKINNLRLLQEIYQPSVSFEQLEKILKNDLSLSYKFLKFLNSSYFGFHSKVSSMRQALMLLGTEDIRKWAALLTLKGLSEDKPDQLVVDSIMRARFGEAIANENGFKEHASNVFMMGMFSLIDVFLSRSLQEILPELPICEEVKRALLGEDNLLRDIHELVVNYEKGNWEQFTEVTHKLRINEAQVPQLYLQAIAIAEEISSL